MPSVIQQEPDTTDLGMYGLRMMSPGILCLSLIYLVVATANV